jgi:3-isopropylmalate dehydratase small subunit
MILKKYKSELSFWLNRYICEHKKFQNSHYKKIFLSMMEEENDNFVFGKRIADFGCGPRGSLAWANNAELRVGIDVLSDAYADLFPDNIINHNMIYVKSTEKHIPTPSNYRPRKRTILLQT